jgi:hypothetical protein
VTIGKASLQHIPDNLMSQKRPFMAQWKVFQKRPFSRQLQTKFHMQLLPKIGLGDVRFGMTPDELLNAFDEQQKYEDWMGCNLHDSLSFHGIIFGFDEHNNAGPLPSARLCEIRICGREDLILWGKRVNEWNKTALAEYLNEHKIWYQEEISGDWSCNYLWLSLSFDENERLDFIELWTNDENLVPSLKRRKLAQEIIKTLLKS